MGGDYGREQGVEVDLLVELTWNGEWRWGEWGMVIFIWEDDHAKRRHF
jgi:hypothetical protein